MGFLPLPFVHGHWFIGGNSHTIGRDFPHEWWIPGTPQGRILDPSRGCVSAAHNPLTHYQSLLCFLRCVSVYAKGTGLEWERPWMTHILFPILPLTVTCLILGVLCESHWHLDGRVSPICVCRPAGVRRSQLCLEATQGVHQAKEKAAAAEDSKCWLRWHGLTYAHALKRIAKHTYTSPC